MSSGWVCSVSALAIAVVSVARSCVSVAVSSCAGFCVGTAVWTGAVLLQDAARTMAPVAMNALVASFRVCPIFPSVLFARDPPAA